MVHWCIGCYYILHSLSHQSEMICSSVSKIQSKLQFWPHCNVCCLCFFVLHPSFLTLNNGWVYYVTVCVTQTKQFSCPTLLPKKTIYCYLFLFIPLSQTWHRRSCKPMNSVVKFPVKVLFFFRSVKIKVLPTVDLGFLERLCLLKWT